MTDEQTPDLDNVVELPRKVSPIGQPLTEEHKQKMAEGRRRHAERQRAEKAAERAGRASKKEVAERAIEKLTPAAIRALEEIITDRHGFRCPECETLIEKLKATPQQVITAAKVVIEHTEGRPAQKVQVERIDKIEYVLAEHEPAPAESA